MPENTPENTPETGQQPVNRGETRPATPADMGQTQQAAATQGIPAVPGPGRVPPPTPPPAQYPPPTGQHPRAMPYKRKAPPRRGGFLPPLWSVLLMMVLVLGAAFGMALLVVGVGGQAPLDSPPRVVVVPVIPSNTPPSDESITILATATIPPELDQGIQGASDLALQGPTLPPVIFTPTPDSIGIGRTVMVVGVQQNQLNVRDEPGIGTIVLFCVPDGHTFTIVDGPTQAEGLTWWKVQDPVDGQSGWAASNYLEPVPESR